MLKNPISLPTPPDEQFSPVRVLDATGKVIATICPKTRARTSSTGEPEGHLALPIWFTEPQRFHYQHPVVTGEKRAASGSFERKTRRKVRDWF